MPFNDYWARLVRKNAKLCDDETQMKITVGSFKRAQEQAYNSGARDQAEVARQLGSIGNPGNKTAFEDLFGKLGL